MKTLLFTALASSALLTSCNSTPEVKKTVVVQKNPHATQAITITEALIDHELKRPDEDQPLEVVAFARGLSAAGRHDEAARVYIDAAARFDSIKNAFEIGCLREAVREYWLAGDKSSARATIEQLNKEQDIYARSSEQPSFRNLKKLVQQ